MKKIEEIFGGEYADEQNVLLHVIKERGYEFFEKTPKTSMTLYLLEDLHKLGYEIVKYDYINRASKRSDLLRFINGLFDSDLDTKETKESVVDIYLSQ